MTDMASSEPTSTEMNPMYATILERPPTSDSPPPSFASTRDTTTSDTALLNPYEDPSKDTALRGGQPGGRLDTENAIYGKGSADDKVKEVVRVEHDEHSSKDRLWTCIRSFMCLVLPVLACVFAAAVLIVILLVAFGVLQVAGQRPPAEQVGGAQHTGGAGLCWPGHFAHLSKGQVKPAYIERLCCVIVCVTLPQQLVTGGQSHGVHGARLAVGWWGTLSTMLQCTVPCVWSLLFYFTSTRTAVTCSIDCVNSLET